MMATMTKTVVKKVEKEAEPSPAPVRRVVRDFDQLSASDAAELTANFGELRAVIHHVEGTATALRFGVKCENRFVNVENLRCHAAQLVGCVNALCEALGKLS